MQEIVIKDLVKSFSDRTILKIDNLVINTGEIVGIVGNNASGKTTLLNILSGITHYDKGSVIINNKFTYIKQFEDIATEISHLSGGEKTQEILNRKLKNVNSILFIDEPTNNLDMKSIEELIKTLRAYKGTMCIISHDRSLLDLICTHIIEIDNCIVSKYIGNYSKYIQQKKEKLARQNFEYLQYIGQKEKLEKGILITQNSAKSMKKAPARMGNSEARLHKREANEKKEKIEGHAKSLQSRLDKLEIKEKPKKEELIKMNMDCIKPMISKVVISADKITILFGHKVILDNINFNIVTGSKTGLIGDNGTGKTSIIKYILRNNSNVKINSNAKIGYFSQDLDTLDYAKNVLDNVMEESVQTETIVRNVLARLLFKKDDVYKNISILSGGEKVKIAIAKILVSDCNLLILDEPTNFLDTNSLEALEQLLKEYTGTVLFTSHDRKFIDNISTNILVIDNKKMISFNGCYSKYINEQKNSSIINVDKLKLELQLTSLLSRLSIENNPIEKERLEIEYQELLGKKLN